MLKALRWGVGLWITWAIGMALLLSVSRSPNPDPPYLAFLAAQPNRLDYQLYLQPSAGGAARRIPTPPLQKQALVWSPDGATLLLTLASSRSDSAIYRLHPQGSRMQRLTHGQGLYSNPSWSPDGEWIAYQGNSPSNRRMTVYRMDREGGRTQALTLPDYQGFFPLWSPDGEWIAFASHVSGDNFQLFRIRADGQERQSLGFAFHSALQWSPQQDYLVFNVRVNYSGDFEIYRLDLEEGITRRLSSGAGVNVSPTVDPTGQWIAFASSRNEKMDIYRMRPDGSQAEALTHLEGDSGYPIWSPDGQRLVFINRNAGESRLYEWQAGQVRPLSRAYGHIVSPVWSPAVQVGWNPWPMVALLGGLVSLAMMGWGGYGRYICRPYR